MFFHCNTSDEEIYRRANRMLEIIDPYFTIILIVKCKGSFPRSRLAHALLKILSILLL